MAKRICDVEVCWNALLEKETGYKLSEIKLCARDICMLLSQASLRKSFKAVFTKFSQARFMGVAKFCQQISEHKRQQPAADASPQQQKVQTILPQLNFMTPLALRDMNSKSHQTANLNST